MRTVLAFDSYRQRATAIAAEIAATDAPSTIAGLVERLAATRAVIRRETILPQPTLRPVVRSAQAG